MDCPYRAVQWVSLGFCTDPRPPSAVWWSPARAVWRQVRRQTNPVAVRGSTVEERACDVCGTARSGLTASGYNDRFGLSRGLALGGHCRWIHSIYALGGGSSVTSWNSVPRWNTASWETNGMFAGRPSRRSRHLPCGPLERARAVAQHAAFRFAIHRAVSGSGQEISAVPRAAASLVRRTAPQPANSVSNSISVMAWPAMTSTRPARCAR